MTASVHEDELIPTAATTLTADDFFRTLKKTGGAYDSDVISTPNFLAWLATEGIGERYNYLINGGFTHTQRQADPTTLATYAANTYSADRWKTYAENASYQYARASGLAETGLTCQYFGEFKKITNTGKIMIYQIIEGRESTALRGKTVTFQCQMKASAAKTIRMGVFELATAGTIDTVPSPIVTAAGANSTDPTMGTNVAIITAAQSKSVTTAMQTFSVSVTVPATSKNLICAVWTDSQFAAGDILYIAEVGLYVSLLTQAWKPRSSQQELSLCQRYFENVGEPGDASLLLSGAPGAGVSFRVVCFFHVAKRIAPTVTRVGTWTKVNTAAEPTVGATPGIHSFWAYATATAGGDAYVYNNAAGCYFTADAEL